MLKYYEETINIAWFDYFQQTKTNNVLCDNEENKKTMLEADAAAAPPSAQPDTLAAEDLPLGRCWTYVVVDDVGCCCERHEGRAAVRDLPCKGGEFRDGR